MNQALGQLSRPRRIVLALALTLLVGAGTGGLVGLAAASDAPASVPSAPVVLPVPHVGDRGVYQLDAAEPDDEARTRGFQDDRAFRVGFELKGPGVHYDVDGSPRTTEQWDIDQYEQRGDRNRSTKATIHVDAFNQRPIARITERADEPRASDDPGFLPGTTERTDSQTIWRTTSFGHDALLPCGLRNPYQGAPAPDPGTVEEDLQECQWGPSQRSPNKHWRVVESVSNTTPRWMTVGLHQTHPDDVPRHGTEPGLRLIYSEDVAYPIMIIVVHGGPIGAPGDVLRLERFEAGAVPLPPPVEPMLPPVPEGRLEQRTETTVSEKGLQAHPFPLSEAYAHARDDPSRSDLRSFLADHPDAYMAWAYHSAYDMDGTHTESWWFGLTDGDARHHEGVSKRTAAACDLIACQPEETTYGYDDRGDVHWRDAYPDPSLLPDRVPRAVDLLSIWSTLMEDRAHPNATAAWDFHFGCVGDDCTAASLSFSIGTSYYFRESRSSLYPLIDERDDTWDTDHVLLADGRITSLQESLQEHKRRSSTPVADPPARDDSNDPRAEAAVFTSRTPTWLAPSTAQTAGIAGASLLVGLMYWLWPVLKTAPAALFSRLDKHELLDHPVRAGIHQAIESRPGVHYQELLRVTGHANGTLDHHLQTLLRAGLVKSVKGPGYTCYFDASVGRQAMQAAPVLKSEGARKVLAAVQAAPGTAPKDVALRAGLSPQTVHYHLHRLREAGLVKEDRDGRKVALRVA